MKTPLTRFVAALAVVLVLLAGFAVGQDIPTARKQPSVIAAPVAPVRVAPGKTGRVQLAYRIDAGYHINSSAPHDNLLLATLLRLQPPPNLTIAKLAYPPGEDMTFEFLPGEKLNVYTGDFVVTATVSAAPALAPGSYRVTGSLRYQACDNRQCYAPKDLPVSFEVMVPGAAGKK